MQLEAEAVGGQFRPEAVLQVVEGEVQPIDVLGGIQERHPQQHVATPDPFLAEHRQHAGTGLGVDAHRHGTLGRHGHGAEPAAQQLFGLFGVEVADQHQHAVVAAGEAAGEIGLRLLRQAVRQVGDILPGRIAVRRPHQLPHARVRPVPLGQRQGLVRPVGGEGVRVGFAVVGQLEQGADQQFQLGRGRMAGQAQVLHADGRFQLDAAGAEHVVEVQAGQRTDEAQPEHVPDEGAFPVREVRHQRIAAAQEPAEVEVARIAGSLLEDDLHAVGETPVLPPGDRLQLLFLELDLHRLDAEVERVDLVVDISIDVSVAAAPGLAEARQRVGVAAARHGQAEVGGAVQQGGGIARHEPGLFRLAETAGRKELRDFLLRGQVAAVERRCDELVHEDAVRHQLAEAQGLVVDPARLVGVFFRQDAVPVDGGEGAGHDVDHGVHPGGVGGDAQAEAFVAGGVGAATVAAFDHAVRDVLGEAGRPDAAVEDIPQGMAVDRGQEGNDRVEPLAGRAGHAVGQLDGGDGTLGRSAAELRLSLGFPFIGIAEGLGGGRRQQHGQVLEDRLGGGGVEVAGGQDGMIAARGPEDEVRQQEEHRIADHGVGDPQGAETIDRHVAEAADVAVRPEAGSVLRQEAPGAVAREVRQVLQQGAGVRDRRRVDQQGEVGQPFLRGAEGEGIGDSATERAGVIASVALQGRQLLRWHCCCKNQCRSRRGKDMSQ